MKTAPRFLPALLLCVSAAALAESSPVREKPTPVNAGYRKVEIAYTPDAQARKHTVYFWYPTAQEAKPFDYHGQQGVAAENAPLAPGRHPLVLFSHGFLGSGDQVIFLTEALARAGYIVAAVNHNDSTQTKDKQPAAPPRFADVKSWDDKKFSDRRDDIEGLTDYLLAADQDKASDFFEHIDHAKLGLAGHSLGGYTVLGLAGAWPSWKDERYKAVLALSPYVIGFANGGSAESVKAPVMLQGGTLDFGITPFLPKVYEKLGSPAYFLVLKGATHFAWTNLLSKDQTTVACAESGNGRLIVDYSVAFFDQHLRGKPAKILKTQDPELQSYEHK